MIKKIWPLLLIGYFIAAMAAVLYIHHYWQENTNAPEQPIAFSHQKHAGELELECTTCHQYADKGMHATVPAMSICMSCHEDVATDKPEIQKLTKFWNDKEPIPWVKIHDVPWHVYFSHKRHVAKGIECQTCHGEVQTMTKVRQVRSLDMGWCVSCHRQNNASTDCLTCHK
ncbi:MAG: cytochrome c3 family protein [Calditrichia bacterium]